jgi:hypothetical protein
LGLTKTDRSVRTELHSCDIAFVGTWHATSDKRSQSISNTCHGDKEAATTMTSEASIPEPPNVFIYRGETKYEIPEDVIHVVTHVKVDPSVKEIHDEAFMTCESLVEVEFYEGLEVIGKHAFYYCINLKYINKLPSTLKEIGDGAFHLCNTLDSIEFPKGLQVIGRGAFSSCHSLKRIKIPSEHVVIEKEAFACCIGLTSVDLPEGLQAIGGGWFGGCSSLKHLRIPSSVVRIGGSAFDGCRQLTSVHLLGNLHTIEEFTFRNCASLTHIRIPSSVTRIELAAFANCTRLISLELPEGLVMIDCDAEYDPGGLEVSARNIWGCESLVSLVLPLEQHVERLDDDAEFMENLELRHVANNFDDLVSKLQHRFDALPVHRLCYYQSYYPLTEAMENLRQAMDADPSAGTKVDAFGMIPFHILALAQTPILSLFQELLKVTKENIIQTRDKFGSIPIDYLCLNHAPEATTVIQSLLQTIFAQRLRWLGLARWKSSMLAAIDEALAVEWSSRRREIGLLYFKLATYERLEATSLLELTLWKVKIDGCKAANDTDHKRGEENSLKRPRLDKSNIDGVDRQSCRINSGADVAISNVLPFLYKVCIEDYDLGDWSDTATIAI